MHSAAMIAVMQIVVGSASVQLPLLATRLGREAVDAVFIDHWKHEYLSDLKGLEATGLMRRGCVVIAGTLHVFHIITDAKNAI